MKKMISKTLLVAMIALTTAGVANANSLTHKPVTDSPSKHFKMEMNNHNQEIFHTKKILTDLGYYKGPLNDSESSSYTKALKKFQKNKNLAQTGVLNDQTKQALKKEMDRLQKQDDRRPSKDDRKLTKHHADEHKQPDKRQPTPQDKPKHRDR